MADAILAQSGIYAITNTVNGKQYIGSSVNIKKRWACHISGLERGTSRSVRLQSAWSKYGASSFSFTVIEFVPEHSALIEREQYWIERTGCAEDGYNARKRADNNLGAKWTDESRLRISIAKTGTAATAKSIALANAARIAKIAKDKAMGVAHYNAGRKKTPDQLREQGEAQKRANLARKEAGLAPLNSGRITSQETKRKLSAAMMGRVMSDETRAKMGAWQIGRKMSPESIEKMRRTKLGKKLSPESIAKREATKRARRLARAENA